MDSGICVCSCECVWGGVGVSKNNEEEEATDFRKSQAGVYGRSWMGRYSVENYVNKILIYDALKTKF